MGWDIYAYVFGSYTNQGVEHTVKKHYISGYVISGKLTKTLGDTSKLSLTVKYDSIMSGISSPSYGAKFEPVKTLLEVLYNNDRQFFGTATKMTRDPINGTMQIEAVGVLGSYQFMPNYMRYSASQTLGEILSYESDRFKNRNFSFQNGPWGQLYLPYGENLIPADFGKINTSSVTGMVPSCGIEKAQKNSKNAYEFLKTITKKSNYVLPSGETWWTWLENGEQAYFGQIDTTNLNTQEIWYNTNLVSCTFSALPYQTKVESWSDDGGDVTSTGTDFPIVYNYTRYHMPNKDYKTPYSSAELQSNCDEHLAERDTLVEAICFDRHLVDSSVPWLDMGKAVKVVILDRVGGVHYINIIAQINEIVYDLVDSSRDKVRLGKIVETITDAQNSVADTVEKIVKDNYVSLDAKSISVDDRVFASCNILDKSLIEQGGINASTDGSEFASSQRIRTRFIPISPYTTYTVSVSGAVKTGGGCYYNASKARVSGVSMTSGKVSSFTSPSGASYVRLVFVNENSTSSNVSPSDVTGAQLEKGSLGSAIVPYTMDGTEIADKLRTLEYNASDRVTQSTSLSDTGVSVTLGKKGWYIIHLEGVANNSGVQKLAMFVNYSGTSLAQLAFSEASGVSGIARMYCTFAGYIEWNNAVVKAYASYSGATQNVINITAKRLYD